MTQNHLLSIKDPRLHDGIALIERSAEKLFGWDGETTINYLLLDGQQFDEGFHHLAWLQSCSPQGYGTFDFYFTESNDPGPVYTEQIRAGDLGASIRALSRRMGMGVIPATSEMESQIIYAGFALDKVGPIERENGLSGQARLYQPTDYAQIPVQADPSLRLLDLARRLFRKL